MKNSRTYLAAVLLVILALVLAACESVSINKLLADPARWRNKTVHVHGTVENSMGALGHGAYLLADDTGRIWVISNTGVPARGAKVDVEGVVFEGVQFGGQSLGVAVREKRHHAR